MRGNSTAMALATVLALAWLAGCQQHPVQSSMPSADWLALDAGTRAVLAPWGDDWANLDAEGRGRLIAHARRWQAMDAASRSALLQRSAAWQALPPDQRANQRARYAAWIALTPPEQARVRAAAAQFAALPVTQQAEMRQRFSSQDADEQRAWLLGPGYGAWIGQAHALFDFVPAGERDATLRMLKSLSPDARNELLTLARRLPENGRDQLRRDLLAAEPARREVLLRQRLAQ